MGDPKKTKKKYQKPSHPWQKERIEEEKALLKEYGLKSKKEIWKVDSVLRSFKKQAKRLIAATTPQAEKEKKDLLRKLHGMDLIKRVARIDDVLGLTLKDIMERRLQTIVHKKGIASTVGQARQFIVHRHIKVGDKKMGSPSYIVLKSEENKIALSGGSKLIGQSKVKNKEKNKKAKEKNEKQS